MVIAKNGKNGNSQNGIQAVKNALGSLLANLEKPDVPYLDKMHAALEFYGAFEKHKNSIKPDIRDIYSNVIKEKISPAIGPPEFLQRVANVESMQVGLEELIKRAKSEKMSPKEITDSYDKYCKGIETLYLMPLNKGPESVREEAINYLTEKRLELEEEIGVLDRELYGGKIARGEDVIVKEAEAVVKPNKAELPTKAEQPKESKSYVLKVCEDVEKWYNSDSVQQLLGKKK